MSDLVGRTYTDSEGRALAVAEYRPGAGDGREVVGMLVVRNGEPPQPYACSAVVFQAVWVDRTPPTPPDVQEANRK